MDKREIRFRAWDKEYKEMKRVDELQLRAKPEPYIVMSPRWDNKEWYKPLSGIILMQFTGLLDKNGEEIYEGDIVYYNQGLSLRGINSSGKYEQPQLLDGTRVVVWKDKGFDWEGNHSGLMFCKGGESYYEIIGNIYENSELLTKKGA